VIQTLCWPWEIIGCFDYKIRIRKKRKEFVFLPFVRF